MSALLDKAMERLSALPPDEQDEMASRILAELEDTEAWRRQFSDKRDTIRRMARQALEEDNRGDTLPLADIL
jgi:hypothetical protein